MAYSTLEDIWAQSDATDLRQLTDDTGSGTHDEAVVARAIADADEEIDGYLGSRYALPLSSVPGVMRKYSVDIAIYNLHSRRGDAMPDIRRERYEHAMAFLGMVARGSISLGDNDPDGNPPESGHAEYLSDDRVFTTAIMGRF